MSSFVILSAKGDVKQGKFAGDIGEEIETEIAKVLKRAKAPVLIGSWSWLKYKLYLYGYKEGRVGTENQHELLAPHNEVVLFGDAIVVASLDKSLVKPVAFTSELYKKFYNSKEELGAVAGDDDEDDDAEEEEEDEEEEEEEEEYDDEGVEEDGLEDEGLLDDDEEEVRPMLRIKSSSGFKKIAKWVHAPELTQEEYVL
jgi:hypothetical protein